MTESNSNRQRNEFSSVSKNEYDGALSVLTNKIDIIETSTGNSDKSTMISDKDMYSSIIHECQKLAQPESNFEKRKGHYDTPTKELIQQAVELYKKRSEHENGDEYDDEISVSSCSNAGEMQSTHAQSDNDDEDEDEIMDEEDLIDQEVHQKAKTLRPKLRSESMKLRQTRDNKMRETLEEFNNNLKHNLTMLERVEEAMDNLDQAPEGESVFSSEDLSAMENSLTLLKTELDKNDGELPEKLQTLRDTIESVSKSIEKKRGGKFSGTERAIQSRESDDVWKARFEGISEDDSGLGNGTGGEDCGQGMSASARFATFLSSSRI